MKPLYVLNGPNLDRLGTRAPEIYGTTTLLEIESNVTAHWAGEVVFFQSAYEGALIEKAYEAHANGVGLILNAGAYTHTSIALHDCLESLTIPKIEVHISNPDARESFRKTNYIRPVTDGHICGFGWYGYILAVDAMRHLIEQTH